MARAGEADDGYGHQADWTRAGDEHILAKHRKAERSMNSIAKWVEDGGDIECDVRRVLPDIRHWQGNVFCEGAVAVDADTLRMSAEMTPARHAVATAPADQMSLTTDEIAWMEVVDVTANLDDLTDELVSDH